MTREWRGRTCNLEMIHFKFSLMTYFKLVAHLV